MVNKTFLFPFQIKWQRWLPRKNYNKWVDFKTCMFRIKTNSPINIKFSTSINEFQRSAIGKDLKSD
jgi:hypothetical protein